LGLAGVCTKAFCLWVAGLAVAGYLGERQMFLCDQLQSVHFLIDKAVPAWTTWAVLLWTFSHSYSGVLAAFLDVWPEHNCRAHGMHVTSFGR
jgi:hypothetical protein